VRTRQKISKLVFALCLILSPNSLMAVGASVAVFPLQELVEARNGVNLPFSGVLAEHLAQAGNEVLGLGTIISFMGNNRIRSVGYLDAANIAKVRRDLGAGFVLLGTVSQRKERPEPRMGLTLSLVRTSDARTVWSYVGSLSAGDERKMLGVGEPQNTADLEALLLADILQQWPWRIINGEQLSGTLNIDSTYLNPQYVRPGDAVTCRVRLQNSWPQGQAPRVFFKADDQVYPATTASDAVTYEGSWVAGDENGRFPVNLVLEWPHYGRAESALLGYYLVDGTPPIFELDIRGVKLFEGRLIFDSAVVIAPRMLVHKPLARWRLSFYFEDETGMLGDMKGEGNLPRTFTWSGMAGTGDRGDGIYRVLVEAWDKAGNKAQVTRQVEMLRAPPKVDFALSRSKQDAVVDLAYEGKVPLNYWRLEMWTQEGKLLTQSEGKDLPVKIDLDLPGSTRDLEIGGFLFYRDALGKEVRHKLDELLPKLEEPTKEKKNGVSEGWVDQF
jgi:TolB-like protein